MAKKIPFNVVFASEEANDYPSSELNVHGPTVHGWHSKPDSIISSQEIVLRFHYPARVSRIQVLAHQYLIPERIELWIHYSPKGVPTTPSSQTFEYLGFIALSDNSLTQYKSRELQSVSVGPRKGTHLKLRLGSAHQNDLNKSNQVALIAVNVLGEELTTNDEIIKLNQGVSTNNEYSNNEKLEQQTSLNSICDDLSFSMYVEESITEIVRDMEMRKLKAVKDERFEYARKLKLCMTVLRCAGERMGRYALAKRLAVQQEDFTTAKLRKEQIEMYKNIVFEQLQVEMLLERNGPLSENDTVSDVYAQKPILSSPPSLQDVASMLAETSVLAAAVAAAASSSQTLSPKMSQKDLSSVDSGQSTEHSSSTTSKASITPNSPQLNQIGRSPNRGSPTISNGSLRRRNKSAPRNSYEDYEERAVPALRQECQGAAILDNDLNRGRSRLNEREKRQAALPILVFGYDMVELFYSRQFQDREDGLNRLRAILKGDETMDYSIGANKIARSSTLLLHRAVRDAVFSVFSHAAETVRALFLEFVPNKVTGSEVARCVDRLLPELLAKSGDPSPRIHTLAQHTILSIASCPEVREQHLVAPALSRTVGSGTHPRLALSRMQMLEQLVLNHGISTDKQSGLTCRTLSECGCSGIHHPAESVRKVAERVLLLVYKINPRIVRKQLPPDDDITRRNLLYRQLFTEFDKIDIERRKEMLDANHKNTGPCFESMSPPIILFANKQQNKSNILSSTSSSLSPPPPQPQITSQIPSSCQTAEQRTKTVRYEGKNSTNNSNNNEITKKTENAISLSPLKRSETRILKSKSGNTIHLGGGAGGDNNNNNNNNHNSTLAPGPSGISNPYINGAPHLNGKQTILANISRNSSNSDSYDDTQLIENRCSFCDWIYYGDDVTQLDKHYWKACPILTKCPQCSQVLEVAALNLHLINECEAKISYRTCKKCTESVHKDLYQIHLMSDYCKELKTGAARCPLCHEDVNLPLDGGWKLHLLKLNGCAGNARRRSKI